MRKNWNTIRDLELWKTDHPTVPWSMKLIRVDGSVVTGANHNIPEAAVALFSTAGFGRIPPRNLAMLMSKYFSDRIMEQPYRQLYEVLSTDKSKFLTGKYQDI